MRTIVVVGALEFLIVLALGPVGPVRSGPGGFTLQSSGTSYNPGNITTATGFSLAMVFTVQGLTGWEAAVPLAEETENPRRNVPIATMASIVIVGVMLVLVYLGSGRRLGDERPEQPASLRGAPGAGDRAPVLGEPGWLALLAMFTSVIGASLGLPERRHPHVVRHGPKRRRCPRRSARCTRTRKTPTTAITAQFVLSLALGLIVLASGSARPTRSS